jgi:hypothetical protein
MMPRSNACNDTRVLTGPSQLASLLTSNPPDSSAVALPLSRDSVRRIGRARATQERTGACSTLTRSILQSVGSFRHARSNSGAGRVAGRDI